LVQRDDEEHKKRNIRDTTHDGDIGATKQTEQENF